MSCDMRVTPEALRAFPKECPHRLRLVRRQFRAVFRFETATIATKADSVIIRHKIYTGSAMLYRTTEAIWVST